MKIRMGWTLDAILAAGNVYAQEGEDDGGQSDGGTGGSGQSNNNGDESEDEGGSGGSGSDDDKDEDDDPATLKRKLKNKREEQDRQFKKLQAAERERDELRRKQEEQDRKGRTELENTKKDLEERDKTISDQADVIRRLTIENAFSQLKDISWHNPTLALKLVDLSEVEFDPKTGQVKDEAALKKAAKDLARENPFLVKSDDSNSGNGSGNGSSNGNPRGTGRAPAGKGDKGIDDAAIRAKYRIQR